MAILKYESGNELYHHGIKGQKWGVRRFQNKNGSYTAAGKKRYYDYYSNEKRTYDDLITDRQRSINPFKRRKVEKLEERYTKQDLRDSNRLDKIHSTEKSNRQKKLEAKYLKEGMNKRDAELAAYKRAQTEKILAITGGVAVTAAAIYGAKQLGRRYLDDTIKPGTTFQNLASNGNRGVEDAFYTTYKNSDKHLYKGMFGDSIRGKEVFLGMGPNSAKYENMSYKEKLRAMKDIPIYSNEFKNTRKMKVASMEKGRQALQEVYDRNPKVQLREHMIKPSLFGDVSTDRKISMKDYKHFNKELVLNDNENQIKVKKAFYDILKEQGYDGIRDWNDMHHPSIRAKAPTIIFNGKDALAYDNVRKLSNAEMVRNKIGNGFGDLKREVSRPRGYVAVGAVSGASMHKAKKEREMVQRYRSEHPNSKLSNKEILRTLELSEYAGFKKPKQRK